MYKFTFKVQGTVISVIADNLAEASQKIKDMGFTEYTEISSVEEIAPLPEQVDDVPSGNVSDKVDDQAGEDFEWKRRFG